MTTSLVLSRAARPLAVVAGVVALAGCSGPRATPPTPEAEAIYEAPAHPPVGRVIAHDPDSRTALVELSPLPGSPVPEAGRELIVRDPATLAPRARLVASPYRTGRVLGARVTEGIPLPDDEVVMTPAP